MHAQRQKFHINLPEKGISRIFTFFSSLLVLFTLAMLLVFLSGRLTLADMPGFFTWIAHFKGVPILLIVLPIIGGLIQLFLGRKTCHSRDLVVITMTFFTIILVLFTYPLAAQEGFHLDMPYLLGLGLSFHIDMLGFTMLLITSVIWFLVMVYAHDYMKKERHCNRFFLFMAFTYASVLGAIMAGDLLTMFLFFEVMTIASYMLVTHGQKEESYQAGYNYIFMGLIGGFAILIALLLMQHHVGDLAFKSAIETLHQLGSVRFWIMGLLIFGFGIKAGMAPVHVWLPRAHPVAPTPASALLSGIMIKVGAYGILRVASSYYFPEVGAHGPNVAELWQTNEMIGFAMIWLGIITMTIGVFFALQQANIKRMLAYHSISQMGYIVMGIGVAMYLGELGAMGYTGALYHIINHALFKSLLFMVAGVVYYHTKEYDMYKLGGLWKKLPLTATVCLIAALGISGMPLFNGFISKTILHHGIVEAYEYGHASFIYAEWIFIVISAGTACSFIKLFYYVFLRPLPTRFEKTIKPEYNNLDTAMVAVAFFVIVIGLFPHIITNRLIIPQLNTLAYDQYFVNNYIVGMRYFIRADLAIMGLVIPLGFFIFFMGKKLDLFHLKLPKWLKLEYLIFYPLNFLIFRSCRFMYGDQCPIDPATMKKLSLKNTENVGLLERFVILSNTFNRRFETTIIKSDALIYTTFITAIFFLMIIFTLF